MILKSRIRTAPSVTILSLEGNVTLGESSAALRDAIRNVILTGAQNILLDLSGVQYIDSAGLGELIGAYATGTSRGVHIKLLHLQKKVRGLMQITHLITVFEVFENEEEALRSFQDVPGSTTARA
ncbi:MAG: STAS domain-containing protein [Bryobacteraceae bacterium]|nr:STAS domain-containing protein [Bryobacteraceae bacterium]